MIALLVGLILPCLAWAHDCFIPLNKVSIPLRAERWVTTKTAVVSVLINATLADKGIEKIQNDVTSKLKQLSDKGEWHIVSFDRQADKSGLENVQVLAQARLLPAELPFLRDKAKKMSIPGESFTIDSVQFTPSQEELQQANIHLRENIYQQAKVELAALNIMYPEQKYYLHQVDFIAASPVNPMPLSNTLYMQKISGGSSVNNVSLSVGNKQELQAIVVLASMPNVINQKLPTSPV